MCRGYTGLKNPTFLLILHILIHLNQFYHFFFFFLPQEWRPSIWPSWNTVYLRWKEMEIVRYSWWGLGLMWSCDGFLSRSIPWAVGVTRCSTLPGGLGVAPRRPPSCWSRVLTSMLYLSTVLLRGSTACQQIRMHRSMSSMPPTITSSFWSLMICRARAEAEVIRGEGGGSQIAAEGLGQVRTWKFP